MLLASIEKILNRSLPRSPRAQALAAALAGRSLAVEITGAGPLVISSTGPFSLLALAGAGSQALSRSGATVTGDGEVAQQFSELLGLLRPEPEEELAQLLGDAPAHHLGRLARIALGFGERALRTTVNNVGEYLAHERGDLVPKAEGRQLLNGIDALRDDVDRFEARLQHLEQRFERTGS
jgi:ubiquinone biosynthesis protein UbiJ